MRKYFIVALILLSAYLIVLWKLYHKQERFSSIAKTETSRQDKNAIIEEAVSLELPVPNAIVSDQANQLSAQAHIKVHESKYEEAIKITLLGLKQFPQNFTLQSDLAALLGDGSEITPAPLKDKMIQKSKVLFERLIKETDSQPKEVSYWLKNEYYYRFAMYREQYELGLMIVANYWGSIEWISIGFKGYYSQGVGAANYAKKLIEQGNKEEAIAYAQKAIVSWAQYFSYKNDYYNSYVHYALALGILGYKDEMMKALQHSANIIKKDLSYHEFKEVIDFIEKIENK